MKIAKQRIHGSPYVGIFATITEKIGLFPKDISNEQLKELQELLEIEIIKTNIANSSLMGVLCVGNSHGFIVSEIAEAREIKELTSVGLRVKKIPSIAAVGNLIEVNDSCGICSKIFPRELKKDIEDFLKISILDETIAGSDLIGSCMVLTKNGFLTNPNIVEKEFDSIKKFVKLNGTSTTANYGDNFVGNSIIANSKGAIVGEQTTGFELIRIDEGLHE